MRDEVLGLYRFALETEDSVVTRAPGLGTECCSLSLTEKSLLVMEAALLYVLSSWDKQRLQGNGKVGGRLVELEVCDSCFMLHFVNYSCQRTPTRLTLLKMQVNSGSITAEYIGASRPRRRSL
jgi:hypothetical protein